jgi:hypothetical protein
VAVRKDRCDVRLGVLAVKSLFALIRVIRVHAEHLAPFSSFFIHHSFFWHGEVFFI